MAGGITPEPSRRPIVEGWERRRGIRRVAVAQPPLRSAQGGPLADGEDEGNGSPFDGYGKLCS
ncbi:hypothetical protein THAOC_33761, partial [Thalassiosira oceanica]